MKLDRELVAGVRHDSRLYRLLTSLVHLCEDLGAKVVCEGVETAEELTKNGYPVVNEDDDDVLRVTAAIANLYITAPEKMTAGRSRTYTTSAGHMTLVAELRDSVTGKLMARAVDSVQGRDTGVFEITNSVTNMSSARTALSKWAGVLRGGLDAATGRTK